MADESIPIYDGEPSGAKITFNGDSDGSPYGPGSGKQSPASDCDGHTNTLRSKRRHARRACRDVRVCFSSHDPSGRVDHVDCPLLNISKSGMAVLFDRPLRIGATCRIAYFTISHRTIHVTGHVRHCLALEDGYFRIRIKLDRYLNYDEVKPAKSRSGREVVPGLRTRKLK